MVPRLQIKKRIDSDLSTLDLNHVCSLSSIDLERTILLFGHNHADVFHFLYQLEIGDEITIKSGDTEQSYRVDVIQIISTKQEQFLDIQSEKEVRMFTCTRNSHERFMIIAR